MVVGLVCAGFPRHDSSTYLPSGRGAGRHAYRGTAAGKRGKGEKGQTGKRGLARALPLPTTYQGRDGHNHRTLGNNHENTIERCWRHGPDLLCLRPMSITRARRRWLGCTVLYHQAIRPASAVCLSFLSRLVGSSREASLHLHNLHKLHKLHNLHTRLVVDRVPGKQRCSVAGRKLKLPRLELGFIAGAARARCCRPVVAVAVTAAGGYHEADASVCVPLSFLVWACLPRPVPRASRHETRDRQ